MTEQQRHDRAAITPADRRASAQAIRVLIVDDSELQRKILSSTLSRLGYEVKQSDSGESALRLCQEWPPDMVLSDWMMPGMNGIEFCQKFKNLSREGYGYFILLTSKSAKDDVAKGLAAGADDFLSKPVNSIELRARLTAGARIVEMQRELSQKNIVISKTLDQLQRVHDSLNSDLIEAKNLQQSLIREKHRQFSKGSVSFVLRSSGHVGGDLVGYFPVTEHSVGFFSIDVSGHGVSSALMTARLAGLLTSATPEHNIALVKDAHGAVQCRPPSDVVADLHNIVLNDMDTDHYFTIALAHIDMISGHARICQAGHPHPLVQRQDGLIELCGSGGLPVGLIDGADYDDFEIKLEPGDRLFLASDGFTECPSPSGEMLGDDGFAEMLKTLHSSNGPSVLDMLIWELTEYAGDNGLPDDVSAALFEYSG